MADPGPPRLAGVYPYNIEETKQTTTTRPDPLDRPRSFRTTNSKAPKRSDLSVHSQADLHAVEIKLNQRPRKALQWHNPDEVFARDSMLSISLC
jgi:hypothetical protein